MPTGKGPAERASRRPSPSRPCPPRPSPPRPPPPRPLRNRPNVWSCQTSRVAKQAKLPNGPSCQTGGFQGQTRDDEAEAKNGRNPLRNECLTWGGRGGGWGASGARAHDALFSKIIGQRDCWTEGRWDRRSRVGTCLREGDDLPEEAPLTCRAAPPPSRGTRWCSKTRSLTDDRCGRGPLARPTAGQFRFRSRPESGSLQQRAPAAPLLARPGPPLPPQAIFSPMEHLLSNRTPPPQRAVFCGLGHSCRKPSRQKSSRQEFSGQEFSRREPFGRERSRRRGAGGATSHG